MTLGINTAFNEGGGDFLPILKFNSDAGRLFRVDRSQDAAGSFVNIETELPQGTSLAFDFGSIEIGWCLLAAGLAPSWAMVPLGTPQLAQPSKEHRQGFRLKVWNPAVGFREIAGTAKTLVGAIDALHSAFEAAPEAQQGMIPVAKLAGVQPMVRENQHGKKTTYRPVFEIVRWIARAAEFGERTVPPPQVRLGTTAGAPTLAPVAPAAAPATPGWDEPPPNTRHVGPPPAPAVDDWGNPVASVAAAPPGKVSMIDDDLPF